MKQTNFPDPTLEKGSTKKWLFFPVSLIIHAILIGSLIVVPLVRADANLPAVKVQNVWIATPPPKPPPPPPPKKGKPKRPGREPKKNPETKRQPINPGLLVAPTEIPEEIQEEVLDSGPGFEGPGIEGIGEGVYDGVKWGVLGSPGTGSDSSNTLRVGGFQKPKLIKKVVPQYSDTAIRARITSRVILEAATDIFGKVRTVRVISGHPLLNNSAVAAVKQWIYEPYIINGIPKPVKFTVIVTFNLVK